MWPRLNKKRIEKELKTSWKKIEKKNWKKNVPIEKGNKSPNRKGK